MKEFSEKVREARTLLKLSQQKLGELVGVSTRTIVSYETQNVKPRPNTLKNLARALKVSPTYLDDDEITDPLYGVEKDENKDNYIDEIKKKYGEQASKEMEFLLDRNIALFAGGNLSQDAKDAYFEALMKTYLECKEISRRKENENN